MGLGIITVKEVRELAHFGWFGHVRIGDEGCPKMVWQTRIQGKRPKGRPRQTLGKRDFEEKRN